MADKVDWLSLSETSNGMVQLTVQKENGYSNEYYMDKAEARYLFTNAGKVLKD